jgi:hypothetical protein
MAILIKTINKVQTLENLENLGLGNVYCDISERGGGVGFYSLNVAAAFQVRADQLPQKFGAGCNYLGGGVRGAIFQSGFSSEIPAAKAKKLRALSAACVRVYYAVESESGMNDDDDDETSVNWNGHATAAARAAGIRSAY